MNKIRTELFGGLRVALTGGTDGSGGGEGPLCVLLHGFGAPGTDLVPLGRMLRAPAGTRFAFPAAPIDLGSVPGMALGGFGDARAWWLIDIERIQMALATGRRGDFTDQVPDGLTEARTALARALDEMTTALHVPPGQIVLGGFSQGAMLSLDLALRSERALAGLVVWSGTMIGAPDWRAALKTGHRRGLRIVQSHGRQDPLLPYAIADQLRGELTEAGLEVDFVPFSGGHEIPPPVLERTSALLMRALS